MAFEITGHKAGLEGAFVRTQAQTAADALRFAREWAGQGVTGITIVNPKGESYDIDADTRFAFVISFTIFLFVKRNIIYLAAFKCRAACANASGVLLFIFTGGESEPANRVQCN